MRFEDDIVAEQKRDTAHELTELKKVIRASERYERLLANRDFQDCLKDLQDLQKVHREQMAFMDLELDQASSPFKINRIAVARKMHLNRMQQVNEAIKQPEIIVNMGKIARARIEELEKTEETTHAA